MFYPNSIEEICYQKEHIESVLTEIKANFYDYFSKFIKTDSGKSIDELDFQNLANAFGIKAMPKKKKVDVNKVLQRIQTEIIQDFEKDRNKYQEILDIDALEEYEDDPSYFKNTVLRNKCPIIRATLKNKKAKELDRYRERFSTTEPDNLLEVVTNLTKFAYKYVNDIYNEETFEALNDLENLFFSDLEKEDYIVYGVIGGGIKSHFLYKLYPNVFSNRSRESVWALWYLTGKKHLKCKQDSQFLMVNKEDNITQQNYFYPYDLFAFYALKIFLLLKKEALRNNVEIKHEYRFVWVNAFLSFVARQHSNEIDILKKQIKDDFDGY